MAKKLHHTNTTFQECMTSNSDQFVFKAVDESDVMQIILNLNINNHLYDFLNDNLLLSERQFGFRPRYSTELAYISLSVHLLRQMDAKQIPPNIFLDLSKAFDTLSRHIITQT